MKCSNHSIHTLSKLVIIYIQKPAAKVSMTARLWG
jgi:hypothetical protein